MTDEEEQIRMEEMWEEENREAMEALADEELRLPIPLPSSSRPDPSSPCRQRATVDSENIEPCTF
jgi:hypothetical protein